MVKGLILAPGLDKFIAEVPLKELEPDHTAFLVTEASMPLVHELVKDTKIKSYKLFFIKDIFSTVETIQEFFNALNWLTNECKVKDISIDATNCITVIEMAAYTSASLVDIFKDVLGKDINFKLVYVHADYEIKPDGVAGEVRGTERLVELEKPIDSLSFVLAFDAIRAFNQQRYTQAKEDLSTLSKNTTGEKHILYQGLSSLAGGYENWDKMKINEAIISLKEAEISLEKVKKFEPILKIISKIKDNLSALNKLKENDEMATIFDLHSNALRRMSENRFDDALARLYSCVERITQHQLKLYGIETKNPNLSKLDMKIIEKFKQQIGFLPVELELKKNAYLLLLLDDPIGKEVEKIKYKTFIGLVGIRNNSILAHGTRPVTKEHFLNFKNKLIEPIMKKFTEVANIKPEDLAKHEHIKIKGISVS
jgi:CRISPR-associated protein (TIGR02710 family)